MTRPDWLDDIDFSKDTLSYHLAHPGGSIDDYIRSEHLKLGVRIMGVGRVYLDQNYWNYCRDVVRGIPQHPEHIALYEMLKKGVQAGKIVCPASHLVLEETLKQSDSTTRALTAEIIQELSSGISLLRGSQRMLLMLFRALLNQLRNERSLKAERFFIILAGGAASAAAVKISRWKRHPASGQRQGCRFHIFQTLKESCRSC